MYDRRGWLSQALPEMLEDKALAAGLYCGRKLSTNRSATCCVNGAFWQPCTSCCRGFALATNANGSRRRCARPVGTFNKSPKVPTNACGRHWMKTCSTSRMIAARTFRWTNSRTGRVSSCSSACVLGLVSTFAKRGVRLPVILDDVLVNFDAPRARAAAAVLNDFAQHGHQIFVFTCHEHIARMFAELKVRVWRMSRHVNQRRDRSLIHEILGAAPAEVAEIPQVEVAPATNDDGRDGSASCDLGRSSRRAGT